MGLLSPGTTSARAGAPRAPARRPALDAYVGVVGALALVAVAVVATTPTWWTTLLERPALLVLVVAVVLGELRPIPISRGGDAVDSVTTSTAFVLALLVAGGLGPALVAQLLAEAVDTVRKRDGWRKVVFNAGQYVLSAAAARAVFCLLTGEAFLGGPVLIGAGHVVPMLVASAVFVGVNHALVAGVVALDTEQPFRRMLAEDLRFSMTVQGVLVAVAPLAAVGVEITPLLPVLLGAPILAIYVSAREAMRREHEALHDPLTGLANRQLLLQRLAASLEAARRQEQADPALALFDLDHFKDVNDTLGHPVGDGLLVQVAARISDAAGDEGTVARLGGDEFAVVVPGGLHAAQGVAARVLRALEVPVVSGDVRLLVQASAGVTDAAASPSTMLKQADVALYDAKRDRGRASTYSPEMDVTTVERLELLAELRLALDSGAIALAYQPQVRLGERAIVGVEALARWHHPVRGPVPPDVFVPLAENSGLIGQLTTHVLSTGLAALARWRAAGHGIRLAVNVSARHMSDVALPSAVAAALQHHGVPAGALVLEITETGILSQPVRVEAVVSELKALGVSVSVDDYGTGNASLSHLRSLAVDELKVDRSFVRDMRQEGHDFAIVRSTVGLAHDLGLRVVAEGVEDEETCRALEALGCDAAQGWHLGRPMPEHAVSALLSGRDPRGGRPSSTAVPGPVQGVG